jgi:phosphatidate cytidylyltransferase
MSPQTALASDIFRFYVAVAAVLLIGAGVLLAVLRWGLRRDVNHAWQSYRGWLIMVPVILLAVFFGRVVTIVFFTILAFWGFSEYARATGLYRDWVMTGAVYIGIISVGVTAFVPDPTTGVSGWYGLFIALPVYIIALLLAIPIARNRTQGQLQVLALSIVGFVYFGWMFGHLAFLANARYAYSYLFYLLFAVELNDVAAYTCGKLMGRRPFRSNISPNKTWEGSLGALAVSLLLPWVLSFTFPDFAVRDYILVGLIVGLGGQLGDLAISVIKRDVGIKDMGTAIPGHGGILDRIDSLIYVAPLFLHVVRYFHDLY